MRWIILILVISIFLLIGAGCEQQPITGNVVKQGDIVGDSPYIRYSDSCCLDQNLNNICDVDEAAIPPDAQPASAILDSCTDTTYLDCYGSYITKDEIFLKLTARRDGFTIIKKISFPLLTCEKKFEPIEKEAGLKIRESMEIRIPCKVSTTYLKDLPYNIELVFYPSSGDTTEFTNSERGIIVNTALISGSVRNEAPEIK